MIELQNHFFSTHSKALLCDWSVIRDILISDTKQMKEITHTDAQSDRLLAIQMNNQQINDALNGPLQHFFKAHLHAYAMIGKIDSALTIQKEEFFKEAENTHQAIYDLSPDFLAKIELSTIKQLQEKCNALTKQHHADWQTRIQSWCVAILAECKKQQIILSDIEIQELKTNQTITELHNRFIDLKTPLPKLSQDTFDFQQYFILKCVLMIQSALARMQLACTEKEIDKHLKHFQSIFKAIRKEETALLETQKKALAELIVLKQ